MTGGFNTNVRGIEIDIATTLNNYYSQNKKNYTQQEFEDFLDEIGLDSAYRNNTGQKKPIETGFVVSFDDGDDYDGGGDAFGILASGLWEYQNWVLQQWDKSSLKKQIEFNNLKYLDKDYEILLRSSWKKKLVLKNKFTIYAVPCEWSKCFFTN